ncbi:putative bifunctional diguanylate cyclase/phosphodiesterase [Stappia stellulata]|uniref:putative bifunctional diguanylate cyclase/phosphodiesterase n=1 Tax=Stappia stellulata TaxID=71235 RepID=UPI0003FA4B8B|nr:EAL domain-containing protein [Stappia stellulata]
MAYFAVGGEARFLLANAPSFVVMRVSRTSADNFSIDFISESCEAIWGLTQAEIDGQLDRLWKRIHPDDERQMLATLRRAGREGREWSGTFRIANSRGGHKWVVGRGMPRRDIPSAETWSITITDVTEQIRAFHDLQASEIRYRALAENTPGAIFRYCIRADGTDQIMDMSQGCLDLWEITPEETVIDANTIWRMVFDEDLADMQRSVANSSRSLEPWLHTWRIRTPSGKLKWLEGRGQPRRLANGDTLWHSVIFDVSEQKAKDVEIRRLAEQDDLTGLANRGVLRTRLQAALDIQQNTAGTGALILIDLDHFKDINDTLGHEVGDRVLTTIAERLCGCTTENDVVARLGGDEFALLLDHAPDEAAITTVIERLTHKLCDDVTVDGRQIAIGLSIGAALFPRDGDTPSEVLKHADIALFEAKAAGRQTHVFFSPEHSAVRARNRTLAEALRTAIGCGDPDVAFQPIVETQSASHRGFEALARWTHQGKAIPPSEFIPLAEDTGLASALGGLVFNKALSRVAALREQGTPPGLLSVNVSAQQLRDPDFACTVGDALSRHGLAPQDLEIEVTETVIFGRWADQIARTVQELHALGVRIALDDFGTGYASLIHLRRLQVHRLKIDQSFIRDCTENADDAVIVRSIISLAQSLGLDVVAEGVETQKQRSFLQHHGCDFAQGYLFGRPTTDVAVTEDYLHSAPAD